MSDPESVTEILDAVTTLHATRRTEAAEELAREAVAAQPDRSALHNVRGVMLAALGQFEAAAAAYRAALDLPDAAPAIWTNLGNALTHLRLYEHAVACHDRALAALPGDAGVHYNRGISLAAGGRHDAAVAAFSLVLRLDPAHDMAQWDRARSHLHLGHFDAGWRDFEVRLRNGLVPPRAAGVPGAAWDGAPFGGRLALLAEQGFGDMIWAHRYLAAARARGGEVVVECPAELANLFADCGIADRIVVQGCQLPPCDLHLHQCSLPGLFACDEGALSPAPYITANPARVARFAGLLGPRDGRLRVGIVWSGSTSFAGNAARAQPLSRFLTAFDLPSVQLFSLQKGPPEADLAANPGHRVIDLAPHLRDFADTAAAIACLDLIIMCDSAVAHLAGAMGREVWVLLGQDAHWLWMQGRGDSPWYSSLRLFRPRGGADWAYVFDRASSLLLHRGAGAGQVYGGRR